MRQTINPIYWSDKPVETGLFADIAEFAHNLPLPEDMKGVSADEVVARGPEVLRCERPEFREQYSQLAEQIMDRQLSLQRSNGTVRFAVHSLRTAQLYPEWHTDYIDDAFSLSPDKSTIGINGSIELEPGDRVDMALEELRANGQVETEDRQLLIPPPGVFVAIPGDSPPPSPVAEDFRLAIIGYVMPNFMDEVYAQTAAKMNS